MKYWIGVACKNHVMVGVEGGFSQLNHGKKAPLTRMQAGDKFLYYAPKISMQETTACQKIVALGTVQEGEIYQAEMSPDFKPFRRDVDYQTGLIEVSLAQLNQHTEWVECRSKLRFGHLEISAQLYEYIESLMRAQV
ncbi:EVE domain-containing protein [Acinetobacter calcoaceticus]|uniref:UPF0310 protein EC844_109126 n=1 Tax=Acinetobacter calcoaceticus TaxID=471 RepID=A0A4R1XSJ9_ACICA|nr:EVE domain-containing protein [Acinetobacter calcoaceticus]